MGRTFLPEGDRGFGLGGDVVQDAREKAVGVFGIAAALVDRGTEVVEPGDPGVERYRRLREPQWLRRRRPVALDYSEDQSAPQCKSPCRIFASQCFTPPLAAASPISFDHTGDTPSVFANPIKAAWSSPMRRSCASRRSSTMRKASTLASAVALRNIFGRVEATVEQGESFTQSHERAARSIVEGALSIRRRAGAAVIEHANLLYAKPVYSTAAPAGQSGESRVKRLLGRPVRQANSVNGLHPTDATIANDRDRAIVGDAAVNRDVMAERLAAQRAPLRPLGHQPNQIGEKSLIAFSPAAPTAARCRRPPAL